MLAGAGGLQGWTADYYRAPFLSVIFNNREYRGVKRLFQETYQVDNMGADIDPSPDFALIVQGCNAHGRKVENPDDLLPALREAMDQVRGGRAAVLDVKVQQEPH
ncbi:MAG: thiamine pyrophosphate-dependent enzyme [Desulfobacterales bacterium]|nr:thiamine pyrophosphate-dependent enzyme [Desulfobacterales bacterium]